MIAMSPTPRPARARAATAVAIAVGIACVGVPAGQAVVRTIEAGRGEQTAAAAANAYLVAVFESGDSLDINRCLCAENRDKLFREALDLRKQVAPHAPFGVTVTSSNWQPNDTDDTVSALVNLQITQIDSTTGGLTFIEGTAHEWRFLTRKEQGMSGGWKVCRIDAPPLCGTLLRC
ncbi:hypothetical protein ACQPYA_30655 [Micromonospora sp. CA-263727]|uniref:hypothetical protein n=1 Tax=Micromonospora sp. CA-263727 TaxID=3239967 RepID=UPI003D8DCA75